MDKRALVTGSGGFVGRRLMERLKKEGVAAKGVSLEEGFDVRDWKKLSSVKDFDVLYHLAAVTYVPRALKEPRETYEVNVMGTANVLELCRLSDAKIIYTSSYVYGHPQYLPIDENHPTNPINPYNRSKLIGEQLCRAYHEDYGVPVIILRPFNLYGIGQGDDFLIPSILKQLYAKKKIELKDPTPKRDFLYVDDMIDAYLKASEYGGDYGVFNLGCGKSHSVKYVVDKIVDISQKKVEVTYSGERRRGEVMNTVADVRKAKGELGWAPTVDVDEGLRKVTLAYGEGRK